ncbi:MAG TPA: PAS domain S-box protein, partial [Candidatus Binataceae bacterium]|nr:PAS domain S-box protein [Candidatus Binataceae bacterium]
MHNSRTQTSRAPQGAFLRTQLTGENASTVRMIRWLALVFIAFQVVLSLNVLPSGEPLRGNLPAGLIAAGLLALTFKKWLARAWRPIVLGFCILMIAAITRASLLERTGDPSFLSLVLLDMTCAALLPWGMWWQGLLTGGCLLSFTITSLYVPTRPDAVADWLSFLSVLIFSEVIAGLLAWNRDEFARQFHAVVESEKKLKTIFAAGTDIISINSFADECYIDINDEFERATGYRRQEVIGKTPGEINFWSEEDLGSEDKEPRTKGFVRDISKGFVREFHAGFVTKSGERRWGSFSSVLVNLAGQSCVVSFGRDITEKRKAEEASRRLAAIVESSEDAIISVALDGTITSWNYSAERLFGYVAEEILGQHLSILVRTESWAELCEALERTKRGEAIPHYDATRLRKDGTSVEVSVSLSPIYDASGSVAGFSGIYKDITEYKRAERELRKSEAKFKEIFETSNDTITINRLDDGKYIAVNHQFEKMTGYAREEVVGKSVVELNIWGRDE